MSLVAWLAVAGIPAGLAIWLVVRRHGRKPTAPTPPPSHPQEASSPAPLALPAPTVAAAGRASEKAAAVEAESLIAELREAARLAGVTRNDPMMPLLKGLADSLRFVGTRTAEAERGIAAASQRVVDALVQARATAEAEERRFRQALALAQGDTIEKVGDAIAASADAALMRRVRVFDRNTALLAAAVLVLAAGGCLWGGYHWGSSDARADIHQTEAGLRQAFAQGPAEAASWLGLMQWNSLQAILEHCGRGRAFFVQGGRRACNIPLWIEPPQPSPPPLRPPQ